MPIKRPLAASERLLARRLRAARIFRGKSQTAFANAIGLGRDRFAAYESGRAILRTDVALALCAAWGINEEWLATGKGDARPSLGLAGDYGNIREPFLNAFKTFLCKEVDARKTPAYKRAVRVYREQEHLEVLRKTPPLDLESYLSEVPDEHLEFFNEEFSRFLLGFAKRKKIELDPTMRELLTQRLT